VWEVSPWLYVHNDLFQWVSWYWYTTFISRHVLISGAKWSESFCWVLAISAVCADVIALTKVWLGTGLLYGRAPVRDLDLTDMGKRMNLLHTSPMMEVKY